jgi:hypothetical protein
MVLTIIVFLRHSSNEGIAILLAGEIYVDTPSYSENIAKMQ